MNVHAFLFGKIRIMRYFPVKIKKVTIMQRIRKGIAILVNIY